MLNAIQMFIQSQWPDSKIPSFSTGISECEIEDNLESDSDSNKISFFIFSFVKFLEVYCVLYENSCGPQLQFNVEIILKAHFIGNRIRKTCSEGSFYW